MMRARLALPRLLPVWLLAAATMLGGAGPTNSFSTNTPMPSFTAPARPAPAAPQAFTTAPTPNQDVDAPTVRGSDATSVSPGLFYRHDQYRGEGLSANSSAQTQQDRRATPGAGINLVTPLH